MEINWYQQASIRTRQRPAVDPSQHLIVSLLGLSGEAGELISEYKKYLRDGENYAPLKERAREELGDLLWYVASVADEFGLSLEEVAQGNLEKIRDRWSNETLRPISFFDEAVSVSERLPRRLVVNFTQDTMLGTERKMQMRIEGTDLGDPLTDNAYEDDGYRFHDIFHWACAAVLGWSPVLRKLLQRKRKSNNKTDEVEDGARATAIEEGISALVFSYAVDRGFLNSTTRIDSELLRTIKGMTRHLEVSTRSPGEWEKTILTTFAIWRHLNLNNGGTVIVDLNQRTLTVSTQSERIETL